MRRVGSEKLIIFGKFTILSVYNFSKRRLYFYKNTDFPLETASLVFFRAYHYVFTILERSVRRDRNRKLYHFIEFPFLYHFAMRRVGSEKLTIFESLPF